MKKRLRFTFILAGLIVAVMQLTGCSGGDKDKGSTHNETGNTESVSDGAGYDAKSTAGQADGEEYQTEEYSGISENGFSSVELSPLSTFSADVDTASYSNLRRMLNEGYAPSEIPSGAVRIEEMLNYFTYENYEMPKDGEPFGVTIDSAVCPWNEGNGLIRIGLKTEELQLKDSGKTNLVFLLDVSGSMDEADKLPLLKQAFSMLSENLGEKDRVSIVTYAGEDRVVLEGARGNERGEILERLGSLEASGSTDGGAGIITAYELAGKYFIPNGNNRVILATDGDLNVGITSESSLKELIEEKRKSGIYLSVMGFGTGNLKDNKLETLADNGNGTYAYIDSLQEARRVMVEQLGSTLLTVAEDVKFQVEFNPAQIKEYRLIGYEDRLLNSEDFTDDKKDAGEVGAGHTVTVLYEVVWAGEDNEQDATDVPRLKYQKNSQTKGKVLKEWATLKIRYKEPGDSLSKEMERIFGEESFKGNAEEADMVLEASVAEFGMLLRNSEYKGSCSYEQILSMWTRMSMEGNEEIKDFIEMVKLAQSRDEEQDPLAGVTSEEGISMEVKNRTADSTKAEILLNNFTDKTYIYGRQYEIVKKESGGFSTLKPKEGTAFTEEGIILEAGKTEDFTIDWSNIYGSLEPGVYRLKKSFYEESGTNNAPVVLEAEFEIPKETAGEGPPDAWLLAGSGKDIQRTKATLGNYSWDYLQVDGNGESVIACGQMPTEWEEIASIPLDTALNGITLELDASAEDFSVSFWMEGATCGVADPIEHQGNQLSLIEGMEEGTYEIHVVYGNGEARYGFRVE